jgi:hypothetical protein
LTSTMHKVRWALLGAVAAGLVVTAVGGAATGGNFILGLVNSADKSTALNANTAGSGPAFSVTNTAPRGSLGVQNALSASALHVGFAIEGLSSDDTNIYPAIYGASNSAQATGAGVEGDVQNSSSRATSAGVRGSNNGYGAGVSGSSQRGNGVLGTSIVANTYGVKGVDYSTADDQGAGVYGEKAAGGAGVEGYGASGNVGVYAHTNHGAGLWAASSQQNGAAAIMDGQLEMNGTIDLALLGISGGGSTPNVTRGNWARLANQSPTNITNLIGNHGQFLIIVCDPNGPDQGNSVLQKGTHLALTANFSCANGSASTLTLIHDAVQDRWYEITRSSNP